jgi:hypothetical protein
VHEQPPRTYVHDSHKVPSVGFGGRLWRELEHTPIPVESKLIVVAFWVWARTRSMIFGNTNASDDEVGNGELRAP